MGELTNREREVATLLTQGLTNKEIALRVGLSIQVVKNLLVGVYSKLGVSNRTQAALAMLGLYTK